jgi:hypothetical protein
MSTVLDKGGTTRADELAMQEAAGTFRAGGQDFEPAFDPLAITGSTVLLVILLGIAFERVLGLDRLVAQVLMLQPGAQHAWGTPPQLACAERASASTCHCWPSPVVLCIGY